jgi:hypothetical protein
MPGADKCAVLSGPSANSIARYWLGFDEDYKDPWLIVTDLLPAQADVAWYGMRAWIECGFKDTKRGGWNWHYTKMTEPARAERHWLVMAVATLWVVSVGGQVDAHLPASSLAALPERHIARKLSKKQARKRRLSCFAQGIMAISAALMAGTPLPFGRFVPFSWPSSPPPATEQAAALSRQEKTSP